MWSLPAGGTSKISIDCPKEFKTEFHPHSCHPDLLQRFEEFGVSNHTPEVPPDEEPWRPFQSHGDFEFAKIAVDALLSKTQINALLDLISCVKMGKTDLTLKNEHDLHRAHDNAAKELTPVDSNVWFVMIYRTINDNRLLCSLRKSQSPPSTRMKTTPTIFMHNLFGSGRLTCCRIPNLHLTLCGTHNASTNMMVKNMSTFLESLGLVIVGGISKCVDLYYDGLCVYSTCIFLCFLNAFQSLVWAPCRCRECCPIWVDSLCWQDMTIYTRLSQRVSSNCTLHKSACRDTQ